MKGSLKKSLLTLYRRGEQQTLFATVVHLLWFGWKRICSVWEKEAEQKPSAGRSDLLVAIICDQMTYDTFSSECSLLYLTPRNARKMLKRYQPDFLFCESCWNGMEGVPDVWKRRIYRNHFLMFENRWALLKILKDCKKKEIPTVFWNKEDPTFYGNLQYDFVDTALRFDWIFTTAQECIPRYQQAGHQRVRLLPFGFSPKLFHPMGTGNSLKEAFFAGSWYEEQPERCKHMEEIVNALERNHIPLTIFDRFSDDPDPRRRYPSKFAAKVLPSVPFSQLSSYTRKYLFAVNINTVTTSETMFARRVYELMAENHILLSNDSPGLDKEFPEGVWFCHEELNYDKLCQMRRRNLEEVFLKHTSMRRFCDVADALGLLDQAGSVLRIRFLSASETGWQECGFAICRPPWDNVELFSALLKETEKPTHIAFLSESGMVQQVHWPFLLSQFSYLPDGCGIRWGSALYEITEDTNNLNCLFPADAALPVLTSCSAKTCKYMV